MPGDRGGEVSGVWRDDVARGLRAALGDVRPGSAGRPTATRVVFVVFVALGLAALPVFLVGQAVLMTRLLGPVAVTLLALLLAAMLILGALGGLARRGRAEGARERMDAARHAPRDGPGGGAWSWKNDGPA
ncbi:hypothetical protein ER308_19965 [Egibacter rhizosphaerae]|uniref:Uncharacterized protein n=1 Tax=Egibacter rhizosphaerae TaxID=1670831 RepID=A0A411YK98_9ACTN|nr:hypothetical protein [Egibacter rhizosphaerae]QBI21616.1 hypothetical protein ER308_19965 [Egibacter rhizosphaerae]